MGSFIEAILHGVQVGGDEGFEYAKAAALVAGGVTEGFWNDQPWAWTQVIALLFRLFGSSLWLPRLATIASCAALILLMVRIQRLGRSPLGLALLVATYLSCHRAFEVNVAHMLEVPMSAFAVASSYLLLVAAKHNSLRLSFGSGAIMGFALNVKLLALLFIPAAIAAFVAQTIEQRNAASDVGKQQTSRIRGVPRAQVFQILGLLVVWFAALTATFGVGLTLSPQWSWSSLVWSHVCAAKSALIKPDLCFSPAVLLGQPEALLGGVFGLITLSRQGEYTSLAYPCSLFITMLVAHLAIKPYWYYYDVHFMIPLAMLTGAAAQKAEMFLFNERKPWALRFASFFLVVFALGYVSYSAWASAQSWVASALEVHGLVSNNEIVKSIENRGIHNQYMFTRNGTYAFVTGNLLYPDLAVLPSKRFWSGNITHEELLVSLRERKPKLLVISEYELGNPKWREWIATEYALLAKQGYLTCWLRKDQAGQSVERK